MDFPLTCLRGLRSSKWLIDGRVQSVAFVPDASTSAKRTDKCSETSINFEDDSKALAVTRTDSQNAKYGVARLPLSAIDMASIALGELRVVLSYERQRLRGNEYHGNILFDGSMTKAETHALAALLAVRAKIVDAQSVAEPPQAASVDAHASSTSLDETAVLTRST